MSIFLCPRGAWRRPLGLGPQAAAAPRLLRVDLRVVHVHRQRSIGGRHHVQVVALLFAFLVRFSVFLAASRAALLSLLLF